MKKIKTLSLVLLLTSVFINAQTVITVDNSVGSNAQFSDLQSAIDGASNGDTIYVHASETNYGVITIDKKLTLIGFSHSDPNKETLITDINLGENASDSRFSGLHITNDFSIVNQNITITGVVFENNIVDDSMRFSNAGVDGIIIRGNIINFLGSVSNGSAANKYTNAIINNNIISSVIYTRFVQSITIKNNIFLGADVDNRIPTNGNQIVQNCIFYATTSQSLNINNTGVEFLNCLTYNRGTGDYVNLVGTSNLDNQDPIFVNDGSNAIFEADIDDYHLQAASPAIGAGISGEDIGLFNVSAFVFNNFGFTAGVPTVTITAITNAVLPGETVEVTIESNSN